MNLTNLQKQAGSWARAYCSKRERKPEFMFVHLHEEVSEAWKEWREGRFERYEHVVVKHGQNLDKPEGLGAEIADVVILAFAAADELGVDLDAAISDKLDYLYARLAAKNAKKGKSK